MQDDAEFAALLEDSAEDLYEHAPCGYLSTLLDGTIAKINATLLDWLGHTRRQVVGRMRFSELLTVGGRLYHETHFAPQLRMQGEINGVALELRTAAGERRPVLVSSQIKTTADGEPMLIRTTVFDARERRAYENELLRARREADRDRARLQSVLSTLQQSLLPPALPPVPGLESAAHYRTASADNLGGDFYDLFPLGPSRWGFFLGDVCGKGPAAAAVTSLARYTLRTAALHEAEPGSVLRALNTAMTDRYSGIDARFCTAVFGVLEPAEDGGFTLDVASGGHPPVLLLRADGRAEYLPTPGGQLVGILSDARFVAARTRLAPGETMLAYTDGLTEARAGGVRPDYGEEALLEFAADLAPADASATVDALKTLLDGFGDGLNDDTALLALGACVPASDAESTR
ncbi:MAG TPA: SpoIIE family protein phosphatase [Actinospica sp.]|nr:SpoIIE family protein phosphatase [Actinospica sp.]